MYVSLSLTDDEDTWSSAILLNVLLKFTQMLQFAICTSSYTILVPLSAIWYT